MTVAIVPLVEALVRPLVDHPEAVTVTQHETAEYMAFDLTVDPEDIGTVIGRQAELRRRCGRLCMGLSHHTRSACG